MKNRCPECELTLIDGKCAMCGWSNPTPALKSDNVKLTAALNRIANHSDAAARRKIALRAVAKKERSQ